MTITALFTRSSDERETLPGTLAKFEPGSRVLVTEVRDGGVPAMARRLAALGFTPGSEVRVVRRAPLGCPVVYRVKDYEICLRRAQAAQILVTGLG